MAPLFVAAVFSEKADDGGNPCVQYSQSENRDIDRRSSAGGVNAEKSVADGGTCVMTKNDHFIVGALGQLLMIEKSGAWGR